jgi:peptidoglycan/xylan/chitin deacetylase (PgdA/CDA1 family)
MRQKNIKIKFWSFMVLCLAGTTACSVFPTLQLTVVPIPTMATGTPTITLTTTLVPPSPTATVTASSTPLPATITPTPFPLPVRAYGLMTGVQPQAYIQDTCQYLYERWNLSQNSQPGTVVVPVMFHSITDRGAASPGDTTISTATFHAFMEHAHQLGFETITTAQLAGFLENNDRIPPRSMILIVDDRKRAAYFETFFAPYQQKYGWTVTNAWISHPETPAYLWQENAALATSGLVEFQAHGVIHNTPIDDNASEDFIKNEIYGPLEVMQQHFGQRPIAFIWPRGLFTPAAVAMARQAGYRLGFTATPRGPLMFNWIPLGAVEQAANDPLMVLPRYWSTDAMRQMDQALEISEDAKAFAAQNKAIELGYYQQYCGGYPELK